MAIRAFEPKPGVMFFRAGSAFLRDGDRAATGEVGTSRGVLDFGKPDGRARVKKLASLSARTGPEFEKVFGGADDGFIVFHDKDRIASGTKFAEEVKKTTGVPRVEADAGFIENEKSSGQPSTETTGKVHSLKFSSRERSGGAVQCEVSEADADQVTEAVADVFQRGLGRGIFCFYFLEEGSKFGKGQGVEFGHGFSGDPPVSCFGAVPLAGACGAGSVGAIAGEEDPDMHLVGFGFQPPEKATDAVPVTGFPEF
jgi:hypothetical protein